MNLRKQAFVATVALLFGGAAMIGCAEQSPKKVPMQFVKNERIKDNGGNKVSYNRMVDILFVVDDSGSMSSHQDDLAANVKLFTQAMLANQILDYHIGVVTSNMDSIPTGGATRDGELFGKQEKFITRLTPNGAIELQNNLKPGTGGSATEKFFEPVIAALTPPKVSTTNQGFFRPDAFLAIVFVTDANEQSQMTSKEFYDELLRLKGGEPDKIITYGVYIPTTDRTCERGGEEEPTKLEEFFTLAKTKTLGLCDPDFGKKLGEMGDDLVKRVGSVLYLTRPAQVNTIKVTYGTQTIPNDPKSGWIYDPVRNALIFGNEIDLQPEPVGTQVEVDFIAAEY